MAASAVFVISAARAAAPAYLAGAHLIRPTPGDEISGSVPFEADLGSSSPAETAHVAFTLYRMSGGIPEEGRYCFLSPSPTKISGTTRWYSASVNTTKVTGRCSSSLVGWGTVYAPEDGTYRFGAWIDGTEYATYDNVVVSNGIINVPPPNLNTNTNTNQNQNQNKNLNANVNQNQNLNNASNQNSNTPANQNTDTLNTNSSTNSAQTNTNSEPGGGTNGSNSNSSQAVNNSQAPTSVPTITFLKPSAGATVKGNTEVNAEVSGVAASKISEVDYFVYSRGIWYTAGRTAALSDGQWGLTWPTTDYPDGAVFGIMRLYLTDGYIYATTPRQFTVANGGSSTNTNTPMTNGSPSINSPAANANASSNTNTGTTNQGTPPVIVQPPALDSDSDGVGDVAEVEQGTNPNFPDITLPKGRTLTPRPPSEPLSAGELDDRLRVVQVTGPGIVVSGVEATSSNEYTISGTGTTLDYLTLFIYSADNPVVVPVQVNNIGTWKVTTNVSLESGQHSAYVASTGDQGQIITKSEAYSFTIDPNAIKKGSKFPWAIVIVIIIFAAGIGVWLYLRKGEADTGNSEQ